MNAVAAILLRELRLALRQRADAAQPLLFYAMVCLLFPLGAAPQSGLVQAFAPAILWIGALLAALLGLDRIFRADYEDGTLEQMFLLPMPASFWVFAKLLAVWLVLGMPMVLLAPVLALLLGLPLATAWVVLMGLLPGSLCLFFIGGFISALLVGLPRAGMLLPLLVLPLLAPVLIFGAGAARAALSGGAVEAPLYFLAALSMLCLCLVPPLTALALRNSYE